MVFSEPVVINECSPLTNKEGLLDEGLQKAFDAWHAHFNKDGKVPVWNMDFAMENPTIVSRSFLYDLSSREAYVAMIGEECRNFIGITQSKGPLEELMPEVNVADVRNRLAKCAELRRPTYCYKSMSWNHDRDYMKYEVLFLPFVTAKSDMCTWFFVPMSFQVDEGVHIL